MRAGLVAQDSRVRHRPDLDSIYPRGRDGFICLPFGYWSWTKMSRREGHTRLGRSELVTVLHPQPHLVSSAPHCFWAKTGDATQRRRILEPPHFPRAGRRNRLDPSLNDQNHASIMRQNIG